VIKRPSFWCAGLSIIGILLLRATISFGQETASTSQEANRSVATVVEVIVTGSNIPTAEEVGPNPVDTYRRADIEKLASAMQRTLQLSCRRKPVAPST